MRAGSLYCYYAVVDLCLVAASCGGRIAPSTRADSSLHKLSVSYNDDVAGHFAFGSAIGKAFARDIRFIAKHDPELAELVAFCKTANGSRIFEDFRRASEHAFPLYYQEILGMANASVC